MTIGERIKQIRKANKKNLDDFGGVIDVTGPMVSMMENGKAAVIDRTIKAICREFHVREEWLRTGEGDMYAPETTFDLTEYVKNKGASELELRIVKAYFALPEDLRRAVMESLSATFHNMDNLPNVAKAAEPPPEPKNIHDMTPDEIRAEVDRQLAEEAADREKGTGESSTGFPNVPGADCA